MSCPQCRVVDRRTFLGLLATGLAVTLAGCATDQSAPAGPDGHTPVAAPPASTSSTTAPVAAPSSTTSTVARPVVPLDQVPAARPGPPTLVTEGPAGSVTARQVAITIDDGYCQPCAAAYAQFAADTGTHITFSPNGTYHAIWDPLAATLRPLIETGQVQIGNHTYTHPDMQQLSDAQVTEELERNEAWIEQTFGITARPWWRPPYGFHDERTDGLAGSVGFTRTLMWNGSFGDSVLLTPQVLLQQAERYLEPGVIMLGHANHPTVTGLYPQILALVASRQLQPVTLDEMFGTSRITG